ncbi:endonuclease/exonuclease/phosphatase family protein [Streptomyces meridianus]|uniref:Endonuclease/exonuclease/phosphatase family protein n=1 Tax=Streptomyces meridianus TaxID=2938945 RepID=A0ABT0X4X4_9ACTN|nr:endonuclease/exonuclease/phosphatase family protein [Streptomyces meridianus]MCM2577583.1 endonuclease/exonuclease/phosphatase family protein [Streptomyces meridianus]
MDNPTRARTVCAALTLALTASALAAFPQPAQAAGVTVPAIQGTTRISPYNGSTVTTTGIVTAVRSTGTSRGFWIQDESGDGDSATSDGIFVYRGSSSVHTSVGNKVTVTGRVSEYYPGGGTQSLTELTSATWTTQSSGNPLPAAAPLDDATVPSAYAPANDGNSIESMTLQPTDYGLDKLESTEGMRVSVADARVVGATNTYGELWVGVKPSQNTSAGGGALYSSYSSQNSGRIKVLPLTGSAPAAKVGDTLSGTTTGPLDYSSFGGYTLAATSLGSLATGGTAKETTAAQSPGQLAVATYNVENLDPSDPASKFTALAQGIVGNLTSPDIVALEEVQDNNGAVDDGTVAADRTLDQLAAAVSAAGGPSYAYTQIDPVDGADGGEPGGNIRQAFLYNPARVSLTSRPGGGPTTANSVVDSSGTAQLKYSPGRIAPADSAWNASRKPLAAEFVFDGKPVVLIANHFNSKGGDEPLHGRNQPPARSSETQRTSQAAVVNAFVDDILAVQSDARVVVLGDLNDFAFSEAVNTLEGGVLTDLVDTLPASERYTYVYDGNSQALDHTLVSPALSSYEYDIVHVNAEFPDQTSDHDPQVVRLTP